VAEHLVTRYLRMLEPEGWTYQQAPGSGPPWWKAACKTRRSKLEVFLCLNDDFLTVQAPIAVALDPPCRAALWRYLLRLNNEMRLVKFTLDAEDKAFLSAEVTLPVASGPSFLDLKAVLTALRTYFDHFHREVELLAANRTLAETWLSLLPQAEELPIVILASGGDS
jgi:Putative bacterial sensory transduction regulator